MAASIPDCPAAVTPVRMNPAWATLEYASIRLMSVWDSAITDPTTMLSAASTQMNGVQSHCSGANATLNTRSSAANAATLVAADMYAVTGVGAPWYASGAHVWNGTAATLNANPTASSPAAVRASASLPTRAVSDRAIPVMLVVSVAPYTIAMPYRKNAEENAPSRKYFIAPSVAVNRNENPVRTYSDSDRISSARNTTMRLLAAAMSVMPLVHSRIRP